MTYRTQTTNLLLPLWQFPQLEDTSSRFSTLPTVEPDDSGSSVTPADAAATAAAIEEEFGAGHDDEASAGQIHEQQFASGFAEGLRHGLAEGKEQGFAAGMEAASKAAEQSLAAQAQQLAAIVARLGMPLSALEKPVEEAVVALALEVARCVIGSEISCSREYLGRLIREAIAEVPVEMSTVRVVLNPADLETIRALVPEIEDAATALVGDATIEAGGCLVIANGQGEPTKDMRWRPRASEGMSQVDLSLASRWRNVMLALFEGEEK